jgi:hypothetical protein
MDPYTAPPDVATEPAIGKVAEGTVSQKTVLSAVGLLTPALFEAAGVPVSRTPAASAKVASCQPCTTTELIKHGQAAWARLASNHEWGDWCDVAAALAEIRSRALRKAQTNRPQGRRYREAMGPWLRCYGFDRVDKSTRSRLLECFDNLDGINSWRSTLPLERQLELNHPRIVLTHWKRRLRPTGDPAGQPAAASGAESSKPDADLLAAWKAATDDEKSRALENEKPEGLLQIIPNSLRAELLSRVVRLGGRKVGEPDARISKLARTALSHIAVADRPETGKPAMQGQEHAALVALRAINTALDAIDHDPHDVEIVLVTAKSKQVAKPKRAPKRKRVDCPR